jgi:hypothetical protein
MILLSFNLMDEPKWFAAVIRRLRCCYTHHNPSAIRQ